MSQEIVLNVKARKSNVSKGELRSQRGQGILPAVVYGDGKEAVSFWVDRRVVERALHQAHSTNVLFSLEVEGAPEASSGKETVLLKELQRNVITGVPAHIDFLRVKLTQKIEVEVPIHLKGEAKGVKVQGGILEHLLRELKVRTLPTAIPEAVVVDVTELEIGHGLLVKDLPVPPGVEVLTEASHVVVNIVVPAKEEAPAAATETVGAVAAPAPEVITKGKKEVEGETAEAKAAPAKAASGKAEAPAAKK